MKNELDEAIDLCSKIQDDTERCYLKMNHSINSLQDALQAIIKELEPKENERPSYLGGTVARQNPEELEYPDKFLNSREQQTGENYK